MRRFTMILLLLLLLLPSALSEGTDILITFTGDCTLGSEEHTRPRRTSFDNYIFDYGYSYPFEKVQDIIAHDDVTVINLENVFYPHTANRVEKTYNFRGPPEFVEILKEGSIELSFLGNNHSGDYGPQGLRSTVEILDEAGLGWFGVPYPSLQTWIYEKDGIKVGFTGSYIGYWTRNREDLRHSFERLRAEGCAVIIAVMHGGMEYNPRQGKDQQNFANFLLRAGADAVVGHHPHVLQGVERIGHANIVYSLGNFSFGGNKDLRATQTMLAQLRLSFGPDKRYLGQQLNLIPAHVSGTLQYNNFQPVLVTGDEAKAVIDQVNKYSTYTLNPYVEGVGALQDFLPAPEAALLPRDPE